LSHLEKKKGGGGIEVEGVGPKGQRQRAKTPENEQKDSDTRGNSRRVKGGESRSMRKCNQNRREFNLNWEGVLIRIGKRGKNNNITVFDTCLIIGVKGRIQSSQGVRELEISKKVEGESCGYG